MDEFAAVKYALSQMFGIPYYWLEGPHFITYLMVPCALVTFFFYTILKGSVRVFRNDAVNLVISVVLTFFAIPVIVINPSAAIFFSVFGSVLLQGGFKISWGRILLASVLGFVTLFFTILISSIFLRLFLL